jgi:hypothetical protein
MIAAHPGGGQERWISPLSALTPPAFPGLNLSIVSQSKPSIGGTLAGKHHLLMRLLGRAARRRSGNRRNAGFSALAPLRTARLLISVKVAPAKAYLPVSLTLVICDTLSNRIVAGVEGIRTRLKRVWSSQAIPVDRLQLW